MKINNYDAVIEELLTSKRIQRIDTFGTLQGEDYAAIFYKSHFKKDYLLLIDCNELYRLIGAVLSISTMGKYQYLKLDYKNYFHRLIMNPTADEVVHHMAFHSGDWDTFDCRKSHLVKMTISEHNSIHPKPRRPNKRKVAAV